LDIPVSGRSVFKNNSSVRTGTITTITLITLLITLFFTISYLPALVLANTLN
jgi:hypothetical protein